MEKHTDWSQEESSIDSCGHEYEAENGGKLCKKCGKCFRNDKFLNEVEFDQSRTGPGKLLGKNLQAGQNDFEFRSNKYYKEMDLMGQRMGIPIPVVNEGKSLFKNIRDDLNIRPTALKSVSLYIGCRKDGDNNKKMLFDFAEDSNLEKLDLSRSFFRVMKGDINKNQDNTSRRCSYPPMDPEVMLNRFYDEMFPGERTVSGRDYVITDALSFYNRMKENSIDVGRLPAGLYGTALLLASTLNRKEVSTKKVSEVSRLSESTIRKRLSELDNTPDVDQSIEEYMSTPVELWHTNDLHPCMKGKIIDYFIHEEPPRFDKSCYLTQLNTLAVDFSPCQSEEELDLSEEDEIDVERYILEAEEVKVKTQLWEKEFGASDFVKPKIIRRPKIGFKAHEYRNITHFLSPTSSQPRDEQATAIETSPRRKRRAPRKKLPVIPDSSNSLIPQFFSQPLSPQNSQPSAQLSIISSQPDPILPPFFEEINRDIPPIHPYLTPDRSYATAYSPLPMEEICLPTPPDSECGDSLDLQLFDPDDAVFTPSNSSESPAGYRL